MFRVVRASLRKVGPLYVPNVEHEFVFRIAMRTVIHVLAASNKAFIGLALPGVVQSAIFGTVIRLNNVRIAVQLIRMLVVHHPSHA